MGNEYDSLEKRLLDKNLSESERIKILEMQKELLLQFLIESNKDIFRSIKKNLKEEEKSVDTDSYFVFL
jgi:hypothetical protein